MVYWYIRFNKVKLQRILRQASVLNNALWILLVLILAMFLIPRNGKSSTRNIDAHFSQMGKSEPRRYGMKDERDPLRSPEKIAGVSRSVTPAKTTAPKPVEPPVTFADVAGIDEVRQELEEIVQFLRAPERFDRLGARIR